MTKEQAQSLLSDKLTTLHEQWAKEASDLMERNGIKGNPLLIAAITEIRDRYFDLLAEKIPYLELKRLQRVQITAPHGLHQLRSIQSQALKWDGQIAEIDGKLNSHTQESLERLIQADYGFNPAQKNRILTSGSSGDATGQPVQSLDPQEARKLQGSIIRRCVAAFRTTFGLAKGEGVIVPLPSGSRHH